MLLGFIVETAVGLLCIVLGLLIRKKQKVTLIHDYHYKNVAKEDLPSYAKSMGTGLILIGAGICAMGIFILFDLPLWWIPAVVGFISGLIVFNKAQKKYNGSWFS